MMMIKNINCKYPIEIERRKIYDAVYEYILPEGFEFWSYETNYGNRIYAGEIPDNPYVIKKKEDGTIHQEL